jgi:hypothetical protein
MLADDAPAMDAPAMLVSAMSNAGLIGRPIFAPGPQPVATVIALEISVKVFDE